jgi:hypothetical protein
VIITNKSTLSQISSSCDGDLILRQTRRFKHQKYIVNKRILFFDNVSIRACSKARLVLEQSHVSIFFCVVVFRRYYV